MSLSRRLAAEGLGTFMLVVSIVGSGLMADRLTDDLALRLLANAAATAVALGVLILALAPISGASFNPLVTLVAAIRGDHRWRELVPFVAVQVVGGCIGALVSNAMFDAPILTAGSTERAGRGILLGEVVATAGLLSVVFLVQRARPSALPIAVGAWIGGAYWFTSSTSLANPAVTIARSLTDSFSGVAPSSLPGLLGAQAIGVALAVGVLAALRGD